MQDTPLCRTEEKLACSPMQAQKNKKAAAADAKPVALCGLSPSETAHPLNTGFFSETSPFGPDIPCPPSTV